MPIKFRCPACTKSVSVSRKHAGKRGRCPQCKGRIAVPTLEQAAMVSSRSDDAETDPTAADQNRAILRILAARGLLAQDRIAAVITMLEQTEVQDPDVLEMLTRHGQLTPEQALAVQAEAAQALRGEAAPPPPPARPPVAPIYEEDPHPLTEEEEERPRKARPRKRSAAKKTASTSTGSRRGRGARKTRECPTCGEAVSPRARTCRHCDEPLPGSRPRKGSSTKVILVAAVALVGLVLLAAVGFAVNQARLTEKRRRLCANQLRMVALGGIQYADDKRFYPHVRGIRELDGGYGSSDTPRVYRAMLWHSYMGEPEAMICPASADRALPMTGPAVDSPRLWFWNQDYAQADQRLPPWQSGADPTLAETSELSFSWSRRGMNSNVRAGAVLASDRSLRNHGDGWNVVRADAVVGFLSLQSDEIPDPAGWLTGTGPGSAYLSAEQ